MRMRGNSACRCGCGGTSLAPSQALAPLAAELDAEETRTLRRALETGARDKNQPAGELKSRFSCSKGESIHPAGGAVRP